ncbi:restriction endonuclease [Mycolicibacterium sp. 050158]|uniref:restriction endonuclease n=1 Tax=Mycolicibacterium sp. 050158 TaxID=3090602 RepID=UPI00299EAEFA|nr:restriction endonuclease [Mycolicibacterium sp. 050158]MDX1890425.1 restriction endonuclease [Mycolicibacterium sp. 050158]
MGTFTDLFAPFDLDPRVRGTQFEHVCKWFLTNDPTYQSALRRVWLWNDWPDRWGGDAGIDLVAEDHDGRRWAIQCKAYAPENAITKADVDKFLSESSRAAFSYRLLIAKTPAVAVYAARRRPAVRHVSVATTHPLRDIGSRGPSRGCRLPCPRTTCPALNARHHSHALLLHP